jgi:hypothetical protein
LFLLARDASDTGRIAATWSPLQPDTRSATWSDDYSDIPTVMLRKKLGWSP